MCSSYVSINNVIKIVVLLYKSVTLAFADLIYISTLLSYIFSI